MALPTKQLAFGIGALAIGLVAAVAPAVRAEDAAMVHLSLKDHRFAPAEAHAPAGKPITIEIKNLDATPAEFESHDFRVEKVVQGHGQIVLYVGPLAAGTYGFYDDFHKATTIGSLVVK